MSARLKWQTTTKLSPIAALMITLFSSEAQVEALCKLVGVQSDSEPNELDKLDFYTRQSIGLKQPHNNSNLYYYYYYY